MCNEVYNDAYYDRQDDCPNKSDGNDNWPQATGRHYFRAGSDSELCSECGQQEEHGRHFDMPASLKIQAS